MERTDKYLEQVRKNIGFKGANYGYHTIEDILEANHIDAPELIRCYSQDTLYEIEIYRYAVDNERRYCAQLAYLTHIDDYCIETLIFTAMPSLADVKTARLAEEIKFDLELGRRKPTFTCWECGRTKHWLDIPGTLREKKENWDESYCGC